MKAEIGENVVQNSVLPSGQLLRSVRNLIFISTTEVQVRMPPCFPHQEIKDRTNRRMYSWLGASCSTIKYYRALKGPLCVQLSSNLCVHFLQQQNCSSYITRSDVLKLVG